MRQFSILIVDDTPNNIRLLFEVLHEEGFDVSVAKSGEIALEQLTLNQPDLILLDVMMPGIDGFETCRRLKASEETKEIPIVFMTALTDSVDKVKGLKLGAVDYITKPIEIQEVLARIHIHITLRKTQRELTAEVTERRQTEVKLQRSLNDLRNAQAQLIQAEKMSSLGQLVAGIAHEINNPVNFIFGNLGHARQYTQDLLELLQLYEQKCVHCNSEIEAKTEEIDFDFLRQDLPKLIDSMKVGAERIREIVLSLRIFSRLDEAGLKQVDIHQGIDSTLTILGHRLKAKSSDSCNIEIVQNYSDLPLIECYAGQLNQVFMNILSNAIDALEESVQLQKQLIPTIMISTSLVGDQIQIQIADNGIGMSPEVRQRIFDPFFTTKPVGVGTGMGLAISYQVITNRHRGVLDCRSRSGQGTEFLIQLPLKQQVHNEN
ncbi:response regulator receiver sensor signal transduction histidine kinase [Leptolyngbya sp. NIES-3755]|nr:response regulator receiver sensor signal transduction histidine kinase [Leptolyngbya sp. NIES-3755]